MIVQFLTQGGVLLIGLVVAVLTYVFQKREDRKSELIRQKRAAYTDMLIALNETLTIQSKQALQKLNACRAAAFLLSSDAVALATGKFFQLTTKVKEEEAHGNIESAGEMLDSYANMVMSMRADCFEKSKLELSEIVDAMPLQYSKARK